MRVELIGLIEYSETHFCHSNEMDDDAMTQTRAMVWILAGAFFAAMTGRLDFAAAADYRLEAMGGIDVVDLDEKSRMNLFNLGNPSGAVFLPRQNRLDYGLDARGFNNARF